MMLAVVVVDVKADGLLKRWLLRLELDALLLLLLSPELLLNLLFGKLNGVLIALIGSAWL